MKKRTDLTTKGRAARIKRLAPASGPQGATRGRNSLAMGRKEHRGGFLGAKNSIVLIDGENFVHRLEEVLKARRLIRKRADLKKVNYDRLFRFAGQATKNYYSTILRVPAKDHPLFRRVEQIRSWQYGWVPYLISKNIHYIKGGYLRVREGKKCPKCGNVTEVLMEKGVDVRLAVDMVANAGKGMTFYLVSSDTDLLPAIEVARSKGAKVVYVAFEDKVIKMISKSSNKTIVIKNTQVVRAFNEVMKK